MTDTEINYREDIKDMINFYSKANELYKAAGAFPQALDSEICAKDLNELLYRMEKAATDAPKSQAPSLA